MEISSFPDVRETKLVLELIMLGTREQKDALPQFLARIGPLKLPYLLIIFSNCYKENTESFLLYPFEIIFEIYLCIIFESMNFFKFESQWVLECTQMYKYVHHTDLFMPGSHCKKQLTFCET